MSDPTQLFVQLEDASAVEMAGLDAWYPPACEPIITAWLAEHDQAKDAEIERLKALMTGTSGVAQIAAERYRSVDEEGWTPAHDDEHDKAELAWAARCYITWACWMVNPDDSDRASMWRGCAVNFPWDPSWWKPTNDPVRSLVKAGNLIAAEIDRLQRREVSDG